MSADVRRFFQTSPGRTVGRPFSSLHRVSPNPGGWFDVTSGRGGTVYKVRPVEFKATLTRGNEPHFAFGKRPTGARVIPEGGAK